MAPKKPVSGSGGAGCSAVESDARPLSSDLVVAGRCHEVGSVDDRSGDAMKVASKRALNALRRGNNTKAAKLINKAIHKFERCGMVYRVQATVFFFTAAGDGQLKQSHIRNVSESAGTAVELSPNSIEYALFHASFLFDNVANSIKEFDELVEKCEKALDIKYPVDPADEFLPHALNGLNGTPERRISIIQGLLRSLIQKANTARFLRLVPLRRLSEIKKATNTPEERRKEIEMMVAAARLLQQQSHKSKLQSGEEKLSKMSDSTFGNVHKVGERRKHGNTRKSGSSMECRDGVQSYWNSMSDDMKKSLLRVKVFDLKTHFASSKDGLANEILSKALSYAEATKSWKLWVCCRCKETFADQDDHRSHVMQQHIGSLSPTLNSVLPQNVSDQWVEMILSCAWKPLDVTTAFRNVENQSKRQDREPVDNESVSDGPERASLLEKIRSLFEALIHHKYLAMSHLLKVIQFTMDELQALPSALQLQVTGIDQSPEHICFLGSSQLKELLKFLQDISISCSLGRYPKKSTSVLDDVNSGHQGIAVRDKIALNEDASLVFLNECSLSEEPTTVSATAAGSEIRNSIDLDGLLSWIYAGPSCGEQLTMYMRNNEDKSHQGMEIIELLDKEYDHLKSLCERKCDKLGCEQAMQMLEDCCLEESNKRDDGSDIVVQSYISVLKKRQELIIQEGKNTWRVSHKFESDAISNVIKETDSSSSSLFGRKEIYGATASHFHDLDSGLDDHSRTKDYINQINTSTALVIQRQKKELSMELSKIDAKIMQILSGIRQLELKLEPVSIHDYQFVVLPLVKSFLQAHLEDLAEKDAPEKALLAELALDSKKGVSGSDTRGTQEKTKIYTVQEQHIQDHEAAEQLSTSVILKHENCHMDAGESGSEDDLIQPNEEFRNLKMQKGSLKNH